VEAEGTRAADAFKKNRSKQRPRDEANDVVSGAQAPDRTTGPPPAGTAPCGRTKHHCESNQTVNQSSTRAQALALDGAMKRT
jgi:hypothetical protein